MGNTESNVTSGVKKQAGVSTQKLYKLVDLKGKFYEISLYIQAETRPLQFIKNIKINFVQLPRSRLIIFRVII